MEQLDPILPSIHPIDQKAMNTAEEALTGDWYTGSGQISCKILPLAGQPVIAGSNHKGGRKAGQPMERGKQWRYPGIAGLFQRAVPGIICSGSLNGDIPRRARLLGRICPQVQRRIGDDRAAMKNWDRS